MGTENNKDKIIWQSYEFDYKEKTADWFWAVGIITLSLVAIAIIYSNPLFAIFMLIAGFTIFANAKKSPRLINFEISTKGVKIDDTLYPYTNLKSFWVEDNGFTAPSLILHTEKFITPIIVVPIDTNLINHDELRHFLLKYATEEKLHQPFSHRVTEFLGL